MSALPCTTTSWRLPREIHGTLVPDIFAEFGLDFDALTSEDAPGGYLLETNPSMQSRGSLSPDQATQVSAGLGYVMYQWSVLVTDFSAEDGDTAYGIVQFSDGDLDAAMAQTFFEYAASVDGGLGGGYMAFENEMIFLNLRGADGAPYSGLDDETFIAQLEIAAADFSDASTLLSVADFADAWLVENDWSSAPDGTDYASVIAASGASIAALDALQSQYNQQLLAAATSYGWEALQGWRIDMTMETYFPLVQSSAVARICPRTAWLRAGPLATRRRSPCKRDRPASGGVSPLHRSACRTFNAFLCRAVAQVRRGRSRARTPDRGDRRGGLLSLLGTGQGDTDTGLRGAGA